MNCSMHLQCAYVTVVGCRYIRDNIWIVNFFMQKPANVMSEVVNLNEDFFLCPKHCCFSIKLQSRGFNFVFCVLALLNAAER